MSKEHTVREVFEGILTFALEEDGGDMISYDIHDGTKRYFCETCAKYIDDKECKEE